MIEEQQFKQRIVYDPVTGKFVTEEFEPDNEAFRN